MYDRFIQIPFKSLGRDYDGCDCWGLLYLYYRDVLGIEIETYQDIPAHHVRTVAELVNRYKTEWSSVSVPRKNDVVLMKVWGERISGLVAHVGVMIDDDQFMHTETGVGCRLQRIDDYVVRQRVVEYRRHRCLT